MEGMASIKMGYCIAIHLYVVEGIAVLFSFVMYLLPFFSVLSVGECQPCYIP